MTHFLLKAPRWSYTALVVVGILLLTLVPQPLPDMDVPLWEHTDKVVHALMFGGLAFVIAFDYAREKGIRSLTPGMSVVCAGVSIAFGGTIEVVQDLMGLGRSADILDFFADSVGAIIAGLIAPWICRKLIP